MKRKEGMPFIFEWQCGSSKAVNCKASVEIFDWPLHVLLLVDRLHQKQTFFYAVLDQILAANLFVFYICPPKMSVVSKVVYELVLLEKGNLTTHTVDC